MTKKDATKISVFQGKEVRRKIHNNEWWFSVVDIAAVLTDQNDSLKARKYWNKLAQRLREEGSEVVTNCHQLKLPAQDGKFYKTDCANTETMFRIIQSIPSPKAEPFKRWLARVGYERVKEIEDPELGMKRTRALYKAKGYSDDWIEKRMRGIAIRDELTDEWKKRGIKIQKEYAILTSEISKATFGLTPKEYKKYKKLGRQNLRDHMNDLELIFSMLGERATTEITRVKNSKGFPKLHNDSIEGGKIAGGARKELERKTGKKVVSKKNYLKARNKEKSLPKS